MDSASLQVQLKKFVRFGLSGDNWHVFAFWLSLPVPGRQSNEPLFWLVLVFRAFY